MVIIKILNEFLHGPIWTCEFDTGIETDSLELVQNDDVVRTLSDKIAQMYDSYYEFDSHDQACWFNEEKQKQDKAKMLDLLSQLNERLAIINDGTFVVEDVETPRVEML